MKKKSVLSILIITLFIFWPAIMVQASGWTSPTTSGGQAVVGQTYKMRFETGIWHNTQQYLDITVTDPDGTNVFKETFKYSGQGVMIEASFIPTKIGEYRLSATSYYYTSITIWSGLTPKTSSVRNVDNTKSTTLDVLAALSTPTPTPMPVSYTRTIGDLIYKIKTTTATVIGPASKTPTTVTIPASIGVSGKDYKVTAISKTAFKGITSLKGVVIGKNVKTIGKQAFYNCKNLKTITIKTKKLKSVESKAFKGIYKKAKIKCPSGYVTKYKELLLNAGVKSTTVVK